MKNKIHWGAVKFYFRVGQNQVYKASLNEYLMVSETSGSVSLTMLSHDDLRGTIWVPKETAWQTLS